MLGFFAAKIFALLVPVCGHTVSSMSARLSRRMALLAAYEDFTRREGVSLRDENFELMLKLQDKKAKVVAELGKLDEETSPTELADFNSRVDALLKEEARNARLLDQKMSENRAQFRKISRSSVSANKLRNVYAAPIDRSPVRGTLTDKA